MKSLTHRNNSSFTLIELLVVLALVAILSVVVVVTLNPAELIKQARDSNRLSDLSTINTALNLFSADVTSGFMGTSTVVYVSLPDNASSTCGSWGLPALPSGWNYNCVTTQNLRKTDGTGWIPVNLQRISSNSPISQLPVDPINTTTTLNYYTYMTGGSWKLSVTLEAQKNLSVANLDGGTAPSSFEMGNNMSLGQTVFPNGWVKVPGNSTFGTSDFWVMKYEAKCADSGGNLLISPATTDQTYSNVSGPCTAVNNKHIASAAGGYPVGRVNQATASAHCQSIGSHLITNNEWKTIAWNIQNNFQNWSGGSVGVGYIPRGNSGGLKAQIASPDDSEANYLTGFTDFTYKRAHVLSNGQNIWDLAGNISEWTNDTITGTDQPFGAGAGFQSRQFSAITNWGIVTAQTAGPVNLSWGSANGIGKIYSWDGTANTNVYAFIRSGHWNSGANYAGIENLSLNMDPATGANLNFYGFRCVR